jgi:hypothetical protein
MNRGLYSDAVTEFLMSQSRFKPLADAHPLVRLILDSSAAYLAIAYVKVGDRAAAAAVAVNARKRLQAIGSQRLLTKLNRALGNTR